MNFFYWARRGLRWAGILDLASVLSWAVLIFITCVYHFLFLLPNYQGLTDGQQQSQQQTQGQSINYAWNYVAQHGYSGFFKRTLFSAFIFDVTLWHLVLPIFIVLILTLVPKFILGLASLYVSLRIKNITLIFASTCVVFFPLVGGIIAINTVNSQQNTLSPKFLAPYSLGRYRARKAWNNFANDRDLGSPGSSVMVYGN